MELFKGMPCDLNGRLEKEIKVYEFLDKLNIEYLRVDHNSADTMELCKDIETVLDCKICKNLFLCNRQKTNFYLLLLPGDKPFLTKDLSKQIGSARLSFADSLYMEKYLDVLPGSVSVLGLINDIEFNVKLLIDEDILNDQYIGCHPLVNTSSLKIKTKDMIEKIIPATAHEYTVVKL